jgi:catechol 2,3-dioxygenase-like lactoylglutathione lyase family enzyme
MDLDHIVLAVSDLRASVPYYDRLLPLLGFTKTRPHVYVNGQGVAVDVQQAAEPSYAYKRPGVGLNHLAVRARSREEVDTVAREMRESGFDVPEGQTLGSAHALFMRDRDGMRFEISFDTGT